MRTILLLVCAILAVKAFAVEEKLRLPVDREVFTLAPFSETSPRKHYFGEYRFPIDATGGIKLHLFPNGRFVVSKWSDVQPDELKAAGSFQVDGDRLLLQFARVVPGYEDLKTRFADVHLLWGWIEQKDFVTGFEVFVFPSDAWEALKTDPDKARFLFLQRATEYNDWQTILREYEGQKE